MSPVYLDVADYIMEKIQGGEWPVGCMIPTEMQLCEQFGVSRPTIRTAVLRLVQEGHLRRVKGKGTFVTTPKVLEQSTIFIESFYDEMYQRGMDIATEVLEFRLMPADDSLMARLETDCHEAIKLTRLRYVKDSFDEGPIVLTTSTLSGEKKFLFRHDFSDTSLTSVLNENGCRRKYVEKEITAVTLQSRESRLLGVEDGSLAMLVTSLSRDADGKPVETCESLYPIGRNQFILKLQL